MKRECVVCNEPFSPSSNAQKTCGKECYAKRKLQTNRKLYRKKNPKPVHEPRICGYCQKEFIPKNSIQKQCSKECSEDLWHELYPQWHKKRDKNPSICPEPKEKYKPENEYDAAVYSWKYYFNKFQETDSNFRELHYSDMCNTINKHHKLGFVIIDWTKYENYD